MEGFKPQELKKLFKPALKSIKGDNGKVTIIGGSSLFHGAPILALKTASRLVDMVFFSSPEPSVGKVAEKIKSQLGAFIWVPFEEVKDYIQKSDAVLIGPGLLRYRAKIPNSKFQISNKLDEVGEKTKRITEELLQQFSQKKWVIDAGSLQTMSPKFIPKNAILTPNRKEFEMLFDLKSQMSNVKSTSQISKLTNLMAKKFDCTIVLKLPETIVCSPEKCVLVRGGNAGLTKGGTGDVLAGLTIGLAAKNPPFLAASAAAWLVKKTADELYKKVGFAYNADDLAEKIPEVLGEYWR
ncbi:MAG: NAD(P)H-hydrate dehydratase [Microgenomates group bacterium]